MRVYILKQERVQHLLLVTLHLMQEDDVEIDLNIKLNIEKYQATTLTFSTENITGPIYEKTRITNAGFVKIPVSTNLMDNLFGD